MTDKNDKPVILIVEDNPVSILLYRSLIKTQLGERANDYEIVSTDNLIGAVSCLAERDVAFVVLDNGFYLEPQGAETLPGAAGRIGFGKSIRVEVEGHGKKGEDLPPDLQEAINQVINNMGSTGALLSIIVYHGPLKLPERILPETRMLDQLAALVREKYVGRKPTIILNTADPRPEKGVEALAAVLGRKLSDAEEAKVKKDLASMDEQSMLDPVLLKEDFYFINKISGPNVAKLTAECLLARESEIALQNISYTTVEIPQVSRAIANGNITILKYVLSQPAIAEEISAVRLARDVSSVAYIATETGNKVPKELLEAIGRFPRFDPNAFYPITGTNIATRPLAGAIEHGCLEVVEWLLQHPEIRITRDMLDKAKSLAKEQPSNDRDLITKKIEEAFKTRGVGTALPPIVAEERSTYESNVPPPLLSERPRYPDATQIPAFGKDDRLISPPPAEKEKE